MSANNLVPDNAETVTTDVIVLGGGPVGENAAQYATEDSGLEAVIVEEELLGGECSYYACIPSKTMLRPIELAHATQHLDGLTGATVDRRALLNRRDEWVSHYDDTGQVEWAQAAGLRVERGHAQLIGERQVLVNGPKPVLVQARQAVIIATGSQPSVPSTFADVSPWSSRDATGVQEIPESLIIVGGGVVAVEAATWMAALGTRVRMLVRGGGLLAGHEPFAGHHVTEALDRAGVRIDLRTEVTDCSRQSGEDTGLGRIHGGEVTIQTNGPDGESAFEADEILVATGRKPRLDDLGLESLGLTSNDITAGTMPEWLYAIGDASGEAPVTHWGKYRARVVGAQIRSRALGEDAEEIPGNVPVPQVVYSDPQVASVGMTEAEARKGGHQVEISHLPFASSAGTSLLRDDAEGTAQIVVDARTGLLLGATFVGPEAAELIHPATVAIVGDLPVHVLRQAVPSFPAASELWLPLLEGLPRRLRIPLPT
ncbi:dihydrolipoyl dehydrogenase family protein [Brevibacterium antiquum]|uniref:Dihydrolipoamide dehydrogenase n=1 Tax=Brevibacterium antiquum CNRZ 918 TaxID=1255637 RepID=A0A2H1JQL9_9MICO|nr:NAD(P)/FAD-dependent oxidoreductase [Brevibacterium antiquum]SMX89797.1 dihydrolipoamide dehydrogenase [Brevibacterium antiquum CNRZ 918]